MSVWQLNVFLSYSRANSAFVDHLHSDLILRDFHVWMDRDKLEGGDEWQQKIASEILRSNVVLVVLSPAILDSRWVREEVTYAQSFQKRIIPVLFEATVKPFGLTLLQHVDFTKSYEDGLVELITALKAIRISTLPPDSAEADPTLSSNATALSSGQPTERDRAALNRQLMALLNEARDVNGDLEREYELYNQIAQLDATFNADRVQQMLQELPKRIQERDRQRLLKSVDTAQKAGDWRQAIGAWQSLCAIEPEHAGYRDGLNSALRYAAEAAYNNGLWPEEINFWRSVQALMPGDTQAAYHLRIAERNEEHRHFYDNARDLTAAGKFSIARDDLETLRKLAPEYPDYAGISRTLGAEPFMTFADVEARRMREAIESRQLEERTRAEAMQPSRSLTPVRKIVSPQSSGWLRRKGGILAGEPEFAIPRETLLVGEPFIARLRFRVQRQIILQKLALQLIFIEHTTRMVREREYHYNSETKKAETITVERSAPRTYETAISQTYFEGGECQRDELVVREQTLRIPVNAMHSFEHGAHKVSWLLRLRLDFGNQQLYSYDYRLSIAAEVYR